MSVYSVVVIAIENLTSVFHKIREILKSMKSEESWAYAIILGPGTLRDLEKRAFGHFSTSYPFCLTHFVL